MRVQGNRALDILFKAERGHYGILAQTVYDAQMVIGLVLAAERVCKPAIPQLMPINLRYGKESTRRSSVPMSVHLDHAVKQEDVEYALQLADEAIGFDSAMIDASTQKPDEENLVFLQPYIQRTHKHNIAIELEFGHGGRNQGQGFCQTIFAPSIGNFRGICQKPPKFYDVPLCLHGATYINPKLLTESIQNGMTKIRFNADTRDTYVEELIRSLNSSKTLPYAVESATGAFANSCAYFMMLLNHKLEASAILSRDVDW
ncbi:hypothetical protein BJ165DRAFT_1416584 [Panaeolus papilionaceus]|nr:hypothetical protein BJ165DRAFT_1416584 [Panaeolus papilionaceus]